MTREELPKLPEGWRFIQCSESLVTEFTGWGATDGDVEVCILDGSIDVGSVYGDSGNLIPLAVISALLFANSVTLPEVPGHSSLLGGK